MLRKALLAPLPFLLFLAFTTLPVLAERTVFPQVAVGPTDRGNLVVEVRLGNADLTHDWQGTLALIRQDNLLQSMTGLTMLANGGLSTVDTGGFNFHLDPGESRVYRVSSQEFQVGYLFVQPQPTDSTDDLVSSLVYFLVDASGKATDVISVQGLREAQTGYRLIGSSTPDFDTGIAVVAKRTLDASPWTPEPAPDNPDQPVEVQVLARVASGSQYGGSFKLGGGENVQKALFPYTFIPDLPRDARVTQYLISSDEPLYVTTLFVGSPPEFDSVQLGAAPAEPASEAVPYTGLSVDSEDRDAVVAFYRYFYRASEGLVAEWTGDEDTCQPGAVSDSFNRALLRRINYFRAMAGAPGDLVLDNDLNVKAQAAALMMIANNRADHDPQASWVCFSEVGKEASAKSNLFYLKGETPSVASIIDGYIRDAGSENTSAGHRRWVLYPRQRVIGSGTAVTSQDSANALWVIGNFASGPLVQTAWPPKGYVPYQIVFERWSFSYPEADFSEATVTMDRGPDFPIDVTAEPVVNGFGDNSIVWIPDPDEVLLNWGHNVTISNVKVNGIPRDFNYTVVLIDPSEWPF